MDPHPARPTACAWIAIDPNDGWWQIVEREIAGDAHAVKREVEAVERELGRRPVWRKGDPKITVQGNQFAEKFSGRDFTIQEAFAEAGLYFDKANTNFTVGRERVLAALRPMPYTRVPRLRVHRSCTRTIYQVGHFLWDTRGRRENVDLKEQPSRRNSDFPALWRYLALDDPTWQQVQIARDPQPVSSLGVMTGTGRNVRTGW